MCHKENQLTYNEQWTMFYTEIFLYTNWWQLHKALEW